MGQPTGNEGQKRVNRQAMKCRNGSSDRYIYIYISAHTGHLWWIPMHWLTGQAHLRVVPGPGEVVAPIPYHGRQLTLYSHQGKQHKQQLEHQHISVGVHTYICVCVHECVRACMCVHVRACMCVHVCWGGGLSFLNILYCTFSDINLTQGKASKQASIM